MAPSDAKKLCNAKGYIHREWAEAEVQLELHAVLLSTILGCQHRVVKSYLASFNRYKNIQVKLQAAMDSEHGAKLALALLVFYFQLLVRGWLEERWCFDDNNNPPSDFMFGLRAFTQGLCMSWLPGCRSIPALATLTAPEPAVNRGRPGGTPGATGTPATGPPQLAASEQLQNPNRDVRFLGNNPLATNIRNRSIRDAIRVAGMTPPNVTRNGQPMAACLSWHVKGTCSALCARRADHVANLADEAEALYNWCVPAFA